MKYIFTIGLLLSLVCCFVVSDVSAHDPHEHSMVDIRNAAKEQKRLNDLVVEYIIERNRYISLVNDMKVIGGGKVGSMQTILISSLSSAMKTTLANAAGLTVRAYISANGTSSLADAIDSAISSANTYHGMATYLYSNPTRLHGYDAANSALEACMDGRKATAHHNAYHTSLSENPPNLPTDPTDVNLPSFECPGTCTQRYPTVSEAINAHYEKCDDTAEGNTENVDVYRTMANPEYPFSGQLLVDAVLQSRSVEEGCGRDWYSCDPDHSTNEVYHRVRTCAKGVWATRYKDYTNGKERYRSHTCKDPFRNCMGHTDHHKSSISKDEHSETDDTVSSSSPVASPTPTPTPTDGTPNCPDCTTHCSSPCGCTNSGTCNGAVTDETPNCPDCTTHCSSPCGCTNSGTCNGAASAPSTPTTPPPEPEPTTVACGGASYTGCPGASSGTEHQVLLCSNGCGNGYWTCSTDAPLHTEEKTCKRSGCSATLTPCKNGPSACVRPGHPDNWHWL